MSDAPKKRTSKKSEPEVESAPAITVAEVEHVETLVVEEPVVEAAPVVVDEPVVEEPTIEVEPVVVVNPVGPVADAWWTEVGAILTRRGHSQRNIILSAARAAKVSFDAAMIVMVGPGSVEEKAKSFFKGN